MKTDNLIKVLMLGLFVLSSVAGASEVTRTIIEEGNNITVFLNVSIDGNETFYSIDESYPCELKETEGDTTEQGHVKWFVINNATNKIYNYSLRCSQGVYNFSGIYMFEGDTEENSIPGDGSIILLNNTIIGNVSDINTESNITIDIKNQSTELYSPTEIIILEDNKKMIEFTFDFSMHNLSLENVSIKKQENESFGYLIISNLDLEGAAKTIYLDNIEGNRVCIIDEEDAGLSDFTDECSSSRETSLKCDGSMEGDYRCTEEEGRFRIEGLEHSALREYLYTPPEEPEEEDQKEDDPEDDEEPEESDSGSSSSSPGSGGSVSSAPYYQNPETSDSMRFFIDKIDDSYKKGIFSEELMVEYIRIKVSRTIEDANIRITAHDELPIGMQRLDDAISYFEIDSDIGDAYVENLEIGLFINDTGSYHTLQAFLDGRWEELNTAKTGHDTAYRYYTAESPGFAFFAIMPAQGKTETITEDTETANTDPLTGNVAREEDDEESLANQSSEDKEPEKQVMKKDSDKTGLILFSSALFLTLIMLGLLISLKNKNRPR